MKRIGLLTIGQSPRDDVVPEIQSLLPQEVEILQAGALDGLTPNEIAVHRPTSADKTLVTRLKSGREVVVDKDFIHRRLAELIHSLEQEVELIGLLCSGSFSGLSARVPLLLPHRLLDGFLTAILLPGPLGVLVPAPEQVTPAVEEIRSLGIPALGRSASPYTQGRQVAAAAQSLVDEGAAAILLHCFGYDLSMKAEVQAVTRRPVILVRSLFAQALAELL
jgi:protein AroM